MSAPKIVILTRKGRCASARAVAQALEREGRPVLAIVAEPWQSLVFGKGYLAATRKLLATHGWLYPLKRIFGSLHSGKEESLEEFCRSRGTLYVETDHHNGEACLRKLRELSPDILITANTRVISSAALAIPRLGGLNMHKSLLPRYAGLDGIFWALYHGERQIGVTVHRLAPKLDTGNIMGQEPIDVLPQDDLATLDGKADRAAGELMAKAVLALERGEPGTPQDLSQRSYFSWPTPAQRRELARRLKRPLMPARIIINADDFGLTEGVNRAVIACHKMGTVSSATLMANGPAWRHAVDLALAHPSLGVGLHFNLTLGRPTAPSFEVPSLVDGSGNFFPRSILERRALLGRLRPEDVARELAAQYQKLSGAGIKPTHIDGHQHAHVLPGVFRAVAGFCREKGLPVRRPKVSPPIPGQTGSAPPLTPRRLRRALLKALLSLEWLRHGRGLRANDSFASIFDILPVPAKPQPSDYERMIQAAGPGTLEIMVHPSDESAELGGYTRIAEISPAEYAALSADGLTEALARSGLTMIHYGQL